MLQVPQPVLGDIHAPNPEFSLVEITVAVRDRRLAQPYGLDLRTHKHDARDPLLDNFVIEGRAFVPYVNILIIAISNFSVFPPEPLFGNRRSGTIFD